MNSDVYVEVAVSLPVEEGFFYKVPPSLHDLVAVGTRVIVPFGKRKVTGFILKIADADEVKNENIPQIKEIVDILDDEPTIPPVLFNDLKWLADYYLAPLGVVLKLALPAGSTISSQARIFLTEEGEKALTDSSLASLDRQLLEKISSKAGITRKSLASTTATPKETRNALVRLLRRKLVRTEEKLSASAVSQKTEKIISISSTNADNIKEKIESLRKRAKVKARLLEHILSKGEVSLTDLSKSFNNVSAHLKVLENEGLVSIRSERVWREPAGNFIVEDESSPPRLTEAQEKVTAQITSALQDGVFKPFLLFGVTGSGKTEIYLRSIAETLRQGKSALVLVPEIALTPQLLGRFKARFGEGVAVLHSAMGRGERLDEWDRVRKKLVKCAIGARSAVFAPFDDLGLIIVDEEHDGGYKQDESVTYNARDFALIRARSHNAVAILGGATPSLESWHNATTGKYTLLTLPERVEARPLPQVEIVDMRKAVKGPAHFISPRLEEELIKNHEHQKQTLLFLNRRGYAPFVMCLDCGHTFGCPSCSLSLTYHKHERKLICHFCDYTAPPPNVCHACGSSRIKMIGIGTERVEEEVKRILPTAKVARLDRDIITKKGELARLLTALKEGELDVLIGTQMIAKGHDYPGVTLVGVILAETSLNFPDFRSAETTFALLTQVAGRAGRGDEPGKVIVQTFNPEHYAIKTALTQNYQAFAQKEMGVRRELGYPPFTRLAVIRFSGESALGVRETAQALAQLAKSSNQITPVGPAPAPFSKIRNQYRWQLLIKSRSSKAVRSWAKFLISNGLAIAKKHNVKITVDVDPLRLL